MLETIPDIDGRGKVSDRIRTAVERDIRDGVLLPGDPINEAEMAHRHQVSRTPVREALIQLQAQGMVATVPRSGMVVAKMSLQQLMALWELLAELEGVAIRLACQRMTQAEREELFTRHEQSAAVVDADDVEGWQACNLRFHEIIYGATRNPYLRQEVLRIRMRTGYYRRHAFAAMGRIQTSFEQHAEVVAALRQRDCDAAARAMIAHMRPAHDAKALSDFIVSLPKEFLAAEG
jgi:DNA-binding GntR family transcriptional regulator